jgi:hypothetical protein
MELEMQSHAWQRRMPDLATAATAGLVGGAVLMVLELLWSTTVSGSSPWHVSHQIAAIVMGPDALQSRSFDLGVVTFALVTHYVLGVVFGIALATIIAGFHYEANPGVLQLIGVLFGSALYLFNFYVMAAFFPWIADLRGWATFIGHLVFGLTVVMTYMWLQRRGADQ